MRKEIINLKGERKGPASIILAGIHGNEKPGVEALKNILPKIEIKRGNVFFGYGNPRAIKENKRYIESNLNRIFKKDDLLSREEKESYEYQRAQFLKKYLNKAEALLDIHASFTPNSKPFIICDKKATEIAQYLPVDSIVSGLDKIEPGGTNCYMNKNGKVGICIECGYLGNPDSIEIAKQSIFSFLKARGHIEGEVSSREQSHICIYKLYKTETDFKLRKKFNDFEKVSKGELIGTDGEKEIRAEKNSIILFARNRKKAEKETFFLGKKEESF